MNFDPPEGYPTLPSHVAPTTEKLWEDRGAGRIHISQQYSPLNLRRTLPSLDWDQNTLDTSVWSISFSDGIQIWGLSHYGS